MKESSQNQVEALIIKYRINLADDREEAGKGPSATHIHNIQRREEDCTLSRYIKYIKVKLVKQGAKLFTQQQT